MRFSAICGSPQSEMVVKMKQTEPGFMAGVSNPEAPVDALQLISDWVGLVLIIDDLFDENILPKLQWIPKIDRLRSLSSGKVAVDRECPFEVFYSNIISELSRRMSLDWMSRFHLSASHFFTGVRRELFAELAPTSLSEYRRVRELSVGLLQAFDLIELGLGTELPIELHYCAEFQSLRLEAGFITALSNDLYSYEKEKQHGEANNAVAVFGVGGLTEDDSKAACVAKHNQLVAAWSTRVNAFLESRPGDSQFLGRYFDSVKGWVRGSCDWSEMACRYSDSTGREKSSD